MNMEPGQVSALVAFADSVGEHGRVISDLLADIVNTLEDLRHEISLLNRRVEALES